MIAVVQANAEELSWRGNTGTESLLTFQVATDQAPFQMAVQGFRRSLYLGIGGVTIVFVLAQLLAIRWGLRPLRAMAEEVRELEDGARQRLSDQGADRQQVYLPAQPSVGGLAGSGEREAHALHGLLARDVRAKQ